MQIEVSSAVLDALLAEAEEAYPRECCGVMLGRAERIVGIVTARNVHPEPRMHFEIDPRALIDAHRYAREGGPQVLGYYHSHPAGSAEPSVTDRAMATGDGRIWAIVGESAVQFWKDAPDGFQMLSYNVVDR